MAENKGGLPKHPAVEALLPDADGACRVALVGFAGPSNSADKVRLYTDLTFNTYFEFPTSAVVTTMPAKANDENSPTVVVVDAKTQVDKITTERASGDAAFLSGSISNAHYGAAQAIGGGGANPAGCVCVLWSKIVDTAAGALAAPAPQCVCVLWSKVVQTAADARAAAAPAPECVCVLWSKIVDTAADARAAVAPVPECVCVLWSKIVDTAADARAAFRPLPQCVCVLWSKVVDTAARANAHAQNCLNIAGTTVCTPTGVPYLCPNG